MAEEVGVREKERELSWNVELALTKARLYWMVPTAAVGIALLVLFEIYKEDIEHWLDPAADWLRERESWSWVIPTAILFGLSFPPLFGHELIMLLVGVSLSSSVSSYANLSAYISARSWYVTPI